MSKRKAFIVFISVILGLLFLGNFVLFQALVLMFNITGFLSQIILGATLVFLALSFISSLFLGSYYYNRFTRAYYSLSAVWIGYFCYLFIASVIYSAFAGIAEYSVSRIGELFILISLLASTYGLFNARNIKVKDVIVDLPNLPEVWKGRKAVWMSDLHLGQLHGAEYIDKVVKKINSLSPDIVFIGGDLFDGTAAPDLFKMIDPLKDLNASFGTYFITGNHEEMANHSDSFLAAIRSKGIKTLIDEKSDIDGLQIIGVDYSHASNKDRFSEILQNLSIDPQKPSILLKHEPKDLNVAENAGISLQISGHTHRAQLWPLGYIAQVTYKGYSYGLKKHGSMQVYTSSGVGTWGPPIRVGTSSELVLIYFKA